MTNTDFIKHALRMIKVLGEGDTPSAEQGDDGLFVLNALIASLYGLGIDLGLAQQTSTTDDLNVPDEYVGGFTALLAVFLQPYYPASQVPVVVAAAADTGRQKMLLDAILANQQQTSLCHLPRGEGQRRVGRILNG